MQAAQKGRRFHIGIWLAAGYAVFVLAAYALATVGEPDEFGYRWLAFFMLAMPWYTFTEHFFKPNSILGALPGFILNAGILFLVGSAIGRPPRSHTNDGRIVGH